MISVLSSLEFGEQSSSNYLTDLFISAKKNTMSQWWFNESLQSRLKILYYTLRTCLGIPRVAELVSEVAARRVKSRSNASGRATIVVILQGIVQAIGVLLSEVKGRVEELSARSDLETGKDSQELPHDNFVRSIHIKMMQL